MILALKIVYGYIPEEEVFIAGLLMKRLEN
jgi:hypothetical protein